jgi:hypothetical protein
MIEPSPESRVDAAIERAARDLAGGAPSPGFTARVQSRLLAPPPASIRWWHLAGAATTLTLIFLFGPDSGRETPTSRQGTRPVSQASSGASASVSDDAKETAARLNPATPAPRRRPRHDVDQRHRALPLRVPITDEAPQLAALDEINDLTVQIDPPPPLLVAGLEIRILAVEPLDLDKKEPQ